MKRGMVVPQDTVLVLNSTVLVPQYWIMYLYPRRVPYYIGRMVVLSNLWVSWVINLLRVSPYSVLPNEKSKNQSSTV